MNTAQIIKSILEPRLNTPTEEYTVELYDSLIMIADQVRFQGDFIKTIINTIKAQKKRVLISTSAAEAISVKNVNGASFSWNCQIYTQRDDQTLETKLATITAELKDTIISVGGYKVYMTFYNPQFTKSEIDNGVFMRTCQWGGNATVVDAPYLADEMVFKLNNIVVGGVMDYGFGLNTEGETTTTINFQDVTTQLATVNNSLKLTILTLRNSVISSMFLKYLTTGMDIGGAMLSNDTDFKIDFFLSDIVDITWPGARLINATSSTIKGAMLLVSVTFLRK